MLYSHHHRLCNSILVGCLLSVSSAIYYYILLIQGQMEQKTQAWIKFYESKMLEIMSASFKKSQDILSEDKIIKVLMLCWLVLRSPYPIKYFGSLALYYERSPTKIDKRDSKILEYYELMLRIHISYIIANRDNEISSEEKWV